MNLKHPLQDHVLKLTSHFGRLAGGSRSLGRVISGLLSLAPSLLCVFHHVKKQLHDSIPITKDYTS